MLQLIAGIGATVGPLLFHGAMELLIGSSQVLLGQRSAWSHHYSARQSREEPISYLKLEAPAEVGLTAEIHYFERICVLPILLFTLTGIRPTLFHFGRIKEGDLAVRRISRMAKLSLTAAQRKLLLTSNVHGALCRCDGEHKNTHISVDGSPDQTVRSLVAKRELRRNFVSHQARQFRNNSPRCLADTMSSHEADHHRHLGRHGHDKRSFLRAMKSS